MGQEKDKSGELIALREKLQQLGIKALLSDLDNTLIETRGVFVNRIYPFIETLRQITEGDRDTLYNTFKSSLFGLQKIYGVNPFALFEAARLTAMSQSLDITRTC
jgi:hypothetical protein